MNATLVHRGPDEGSVDTFGRCVLGHRRLQVIDLATGSQPVTNERGDVVAVFNGELYTFAELRAELAAKGHDVRGTGDTPVIPHLYEEHGPDFVERLSGMFAVAVWDASRERLLLARDRVGKKPLLWTRLSDGTLAFASELKALLALGIRREIDPAAIDEFLALQYIRAPRTALRGVHKLPPAHYLVAENGNEHLERYWQLEPRDSASVDEVREAVLGAVRRRLVADVPLGALLSGGLDSSVVVAAMAQASAAPVRTFTVGFGEPRYDERPYARAVAQRYGTEHTELVVEPNVPETLERLVETFDEPLGDEAALPTFLISEVARQHVTVALTGDGGDEAFAGYERYRAHRLAGRLHGAPGLGASGSALRRLSREPRSTANRAGRFLQAAAASPAERYSRLMEVFPLALRRELLGEAHEVRLEPPRSGVAGLQLLDVETYLPGDLLLKADLASMAHSLELRSPLLDHEVLELGVSLPESLAGKQALRQAFAADLPAEVLTRRKTGFGVPISSWFRNELREPAADLLLADRSLVSRATVKRLLDEHVSGRVDHGHRLWCLVVLELWQRRWVDSPSLVPA